ncbi:MAG: hypothetical protein KBT03_08925 [Bacteroidales bacterium]|nr:hypothetical protein [Candidatus Scybalousia scybalohippi]
MELKYIVYVTVNLSNGKLYFGVHRTNPDVFDGYIGCGIYNERNATNKYPFHKAVKKYGYKNFKRTIIQVFPDTEEGKRQAYELEAQIVTSTLLKSKNVYNAKRGGEGGCQIETKKVYQFDLKGEFLRSYQSINDAAISLHPNTNLYNIIKAIRNNCLGASQSAYGYYWSYKKEFSYNKEYTKIAQYTASGKFIRMFDSITEAEEALQLNTIKQSLSKGYLSGGYQWKYYNNDDSDIEPYYSVYVDNLPIQMLNKANEVVGEYDTIKECATQNNLDVSQIRRVLKRIIRSHKGYKFQYKR